MAKLLESFEELKALTSIEMKKASDLITRYEAFDNPKTIIAGCQIDNIECKHGGGYEFIVYYDPKINEKFPHITDSIYCEIVSYQGKDFLLDCHVTRPDISRAQHSLVKRYAVIKDAFKAMLSFIEDAEVFREGNVTRAFMAFNKFEAI